MKNNLRDLRKSLGLTQAALAEKVGVSQPTIKRLETDESSLTPDWIERLASALDVMPGEILNMETPATRRLLIKGQVAAGPWIEMFEDPEPDTIPYPTRARHAYALRVAGDSMDQVAPDGSFVVVDPDQIDAQRLHAHLVVAQQGPDATFKRLDLTHGLLLPYSSRWQEPIPLNDGVMITGKVIGIIKDMD